MSEDTVKVEVVDREPQLPVAVVIKIMVIGITLATVIPTAIVLFLNHQDTANRLAENKALVQQNEQLTRRFNAERNERLRDTNEFLFDQCQKGELRDAVVVQQNNAVLAILNRIPKSQRSTYMHRLIFSLQDTNRILEPPGEESCKPPPVSTK